MVQMSQTHVDEFLQTPRYAAFGTNSADGPPQLTTVWFLYEGGDFYFYIERTTVKYRNMVRDPRVSACIHGEHPSGRSVVVYGLARVQEKGTPEADRIAWRMIRRYNDTDEEARRYEASEQGLDMVMIRVTPQKIVALDQSG